jgi:hypothetical protein
MFEKASRIGEDSKARQCDKFLRLHKAQHPVPLAAIETVVNLSGKPLDDPVLIPIEGFEVCSGSDGIAQSTSSLG